MEIVDKLLGKRKKAENKDNLNMLDFTHPTSRRHLPVATLVEDIASGRITDQEVIEARCRGLYPNLPPEQIAQDALTLTELIKEFVEKKDKANLKV